MIKVHKLTNLQKKKILLRCLANIPTKNGGRDVFMKLPITKLSLIVESLKSPAAFIELSQLNPQFSLVKTCPTHLPSLRNLTRDAHEKFREVGGIVPAKSVFMGGFPEMEVPQNGWEADDL